MLSVPHNVRSLIISNILIRINYFLNEWIDYKCRYIYVRIKINNIYFSFFIQYYSDYNKNIKSNLSNRVEITNRTVDCDQMIDMKSTSMTTILYRFIRCELFHILTPRHTIIIIKHVIDR